MKRIEVRLEEKGNEIKARKLELDAIVLRKKDIESILKKREQLVESITDDSTEEDVKTVTESIEGLECDEKALQEIQEKEMLIKKEIDKSEKELADLEKELESIEKELTTPKGEEGELRNMEQELLIEKRDAMNAFIRSYGKEIRSGIKTVDAAAVIPTEIVHNPELEVNTVQDLSTLVTKTKVNTASGEYPILKRASAGLSTVEELEENPALAKPEFLNVAWKVKTYRGAIPISQESIDDAAVNLVSLVAQNAQEQKINTINARISEVLKSFDPKEVSDADGLKKIFNVELDAAYNVSVVASQSFFHELDTMKDNTGRYLLQDDITSPSGKRIFGKQITVVNDDLLGLAGEAHAFVGDLKRGVLFADRRDIALDWLKHEIYGQYLAVFIRMDVKKADASAGKFVTFKPAAKPKNKEDSQ